MDGSIEGKAIDLGFLPILGENPKVLILGTMPSVKSLEESQYYGHSRNAFWWLMAQINGFDSELSYQQRTEKLIENRIAVWDVIRSCHRPGSLDSSIDPSTVIANNFSTLLNENASLRVVAFNGQSASKLFSKFVTLDGWKGDFVTLPSTSPANAAMTRDAKLEKWSALRAYL